MMKLQIVVSLAALSVFAGISAEALAQSTGLQPEAIFQSLDTNGDGTLTSKEVGKERGRFFDRLVRIGDSNSDGNLSRAEFIAAVNRKPAEVRSSSSRSGRNGRNGRFGQRRRPDSRALFDRFDTNRDGKLTLSELPQFLRSRLKPHFDRLGKNEMTREQFARVTQAFGNSGRGNAAVAIMRQFDKNRDGVIDKSEAQGRLKENFDRIDANRNGKLEAAELARIQGDRASGRKRPTQGKRPAQRKRPKQ